MTTRSSISFLSFGLALSLSSLAPPSARAAEPSEAATSRKLVHVSFGFTKAFFAEYNPWFAERWKRQTGETVVIEQSHGPSGTQTEAVIQGRLSPDVVSLASPDDIDAIARQTSLVEIGWRRTFPNASSPYSSAVVFAVRRGNPKGIKDWGDLALPGRALVTSNPKACGGGRWNYTAAFGLGGADASSRKDYLAGFLHNVPVVYANQGEAGEAFLKKGQGDVLLTYESFALGLAAKPDAPIEVVVPPRTVKIELPVAVATLNSEKNHTTKLARAYLRGLFEPEAQELAAKHFLRPQDKAVSARNARRFPQVRLVSGKEIFPSHDRAEKEHFSEGGLFDALHSPAPATAAAR